MKRKAKKALKEFREVLGEYIALGLAGFSYGDPYPHLRAAFTKALTAYAALDSQYPGEGDLDEVQWTLKEGQTLVKIITMTYIEREY